MKSSGIAFRWFSEILVIELELLNNFQGHNFDWKICNKYFDIYLNLNFNFNAICLCLKLNLISHRSIFILFFGFPIQNLFIYVVLFVYFFFQHLTLGKISRT